MDITALNSLNFLQEWDAYTCERSVIGCQFFFFQPQKLQILVPLLVGHFCGKSH